MACGKEIKGNTVDLKTFLNWGLQNVLGYETEDKTGKICVVKVWCKICAKYRDRLLKDPDTRGAATTSLLQYTDGTRSVTKSNCHRHLAGKTHKQALDMYAIDSAIDGREDDMPQPTPPKQPSIDTTMTKQTEEAYTKLMRTKAVCCDPMASQDFSNVAPTVKMETMEANEDPAAPGIATEAVLVRSEPMPEGSEEVKGYDFNKGVDYHALFTSMTTTGFQATNVGRAIREINRMIDCKFQPIPSDKQPEINLNPCGRQLSNCTIFLSYTSNLISAGTREAIRYLVEHNMVDCIVTTAGGIEEDLIKCLAPTYLGDFSLPGRELRAKGINRIGNLLVPNSNYCLFEDWVVPILDKMLEEQTTENVLWTPSKMISRLGKEIDNPESVYYWAHKNNIPVLCPAITDGSLGDMIYFHSYSKPGLVVDIVDDIRLMNSQAVHAVNTGMIILGGGLIKHHTCNANLMRNGADFSVYVNTANEFDGSDSGARPDEAISWGKIKATADPVKVYGEASMIFPILLAESFARREKEFKEFNTIIK